MVILVIHIYSYISGKDLDAFNINIPPGFYFKTQMRFWNYNISAEIKFSPNPFNLYMDCSMSPLNWLWGLIKVQRSEDNDQEGPKLYVDISPSRFDMHIEGIYFILILRITTSQ